MCRISPVAVLSVLKNCVTNEENTLERLLRVNRGAAEPQKLRGVRVRRGGGAEEPSEPSAEQEQRAGAAEQRPQQ